MSFMFLSAFILIQNAIGMQLPARSVEEAVRSVIWRGAGDEVFGRARNTSAFFVARSDSGAARSDSIMARSGSGPASAVDTWLPRFSQQEVEPRTNRASTTRGWLVLNEMATDDRLKLYVSQHKKPYVIV